MLTTTVRSASPCDRSAVTNGYEALVARGDIENDPAQHAAARKLDALSIEIDKAAPFRLVRDCFVGHSGARNKKGVYICGPVGTGKTMLMDLFFDSVEIAAKRRVHFHQFMLEFHERLQTARAGGGPPHGEPISHVVRSIAREARLLCFDELVVTDIADAMILSRVFAALFARGVTVVATSNVELENLYHHGINRSRLLPFIGLLRETLEVLRLDTQTDFRREKRAADCVWHVPANDAARDALDRAFEVATGGTAASRVTLRFNGRSITVPRQAAGVARFAFRELCAAFFGAADYIAIAERFRTIIVDDIPVMDFDKRKHAKRLGTLIDILYQHKTKLIASAAAQPDDLYVGGRGPEADEFPRTASRLIEMRSRDYVEAPCVAVGKAQLADHARENEAARRDDRSTAGG